MEFDSYNDPRYRLIADEINSRLPELMCEKYKCQRNLTTPTHVILPKRLYNRYIGDDGDPNFKGSLMGLPIIWSDDEQWGLAIVLKNKEGS